MTLGPAAPPGGPYLLAGHSSSVEGMLFSEISSTFKGVLCFTNKLIPLEINSWLCKV